MKKLLLIAAIVFFIQVGKAQTGSIDYFGQTPSGDSAVVFAPGTISLSNRDENKIAFSQDGNECLIKTGAGLLYTKQESGHWSEIKKADFIGNLNAGEPFFAPDSQKVFFSGYVTTYLEADIYVSVKENQTWTSPIKLGSPVNSGAEEWHPSVALNRTLYYCSSRNNPSGKYNIYCSKYVNESYSTVEKLSSIINSQYGAWDPYIAPDESYIIFSSIRSDGYGSVDQYISYNKDGRWTNPKNLGSKINTDKAEYGSYVSPDNKYYFFCKSNGSQTDIYWISTGFIDSLMHTNFVPYVKLPIPNQINSVGNTFNYTIPDSTFVDDDGNNTLTYFATLSNGTHLPSWLPFNPETRTFSGTSDTAGIFKIKVTVTDTENASASTEFNFTIKANPNSVNRIDEQNILIYPNPSNGKFNISFGEKLYHLTSIEINNLRGVRVFSNNYYNATNTVVDLMDYPTGIYLVKAIADERIYYRKVCIE